jgi:CBS-domain-containing membrane protein
VATRLDAEATTLETIMSRNLVTARSESTDLAVLMGLEGVRRIVLVDAKGNLAGLVSLDDLLAVHAHRISCLAGTLAHERGKESTTLAE